MDYCNPQAPHTNESSRVRHISRFQFLPLYYYKCDATIVVEPRALQTVTLSETFRSNIYATSCYNIRKALLLRNIKQTQRKRRGQHTFEKDLLW